MQQPTQLYAHKKRLPLVFAGLILSLLMSYRWPTLPALAQTTPEPGQAESPQIYLPYFPEEVRFGETAIFWFGQVDADNNYADVRVAYTTEELYLYVAVFDRQMWYQENPPDPAALSEWDAVTLYLSTGEGTAPYRLTAQVNHWQDRAAYQAAWRANGGAWTLNNLTFESESAWRGDNPNDNSSDERGWALTFHIPFSNFGLDSPPAFTTPWRLGMSLHDRDSASGPVRAAVNWPVGFSAQDRTTWGELYFGQPVYTPPTVEQPQTLSIFHGADVNVPDAAVGGSSDCGASLDFWGNWGDANYAGKPDFNIQNQSDVADWPCFSKYYVTFPLNLLPPAQQIVSATLTLHLFGSAGGGEWGEAYPSAIQVGIADAPWQEDQLTWNNAPLLHKNISQSWVNPVAEFPGWPGIPYTWDVSSAVAAAYQQNEPLRLVLYSADSDYHSGKFFVSSDTGDWNEEGRPTLTIIYGEGSDVPPTPTPQPTPSLRHHLYLPRLTDTQN